MQSCSKKNGCPAECCVYLFPFLLMGSIPGRLTFFQEFQESCFFSSILYVSFSKFQAVVTLPYFSFLQFLRDSSCIITTAIDSLAFIPKKENRKVLIFFLLLTIYFFNWQACNTLKAKEIIYPFIEIHILIKELLFLYFKITKKFLHQRN